MREAFRNFLAGVLRLTSFASAASDGTGRLAPRPLPGTQQGPAMPTRLAAPYGFRSRPPSDVDAMEVRLDGGPYGSVAVPLDTSTYGPGDLPEAEVCLYNDKQPKALRTDGDQLIAQEGAKKVATDTTPVKVTGGSYTPTSLTLAIVDSAGAVGTIAITVAAGALAVIPVGVVPAGTFKMQGAVDGGCPDFLAPGP